MCFWILLNNYNIIITVVRNIEAHDFFKANNKPLRELQSDAKLYVTRDHVSQKKKPVTITIL